MEVLKILAKTPRFFIIWLDCYNVAQSK